jgi:predicted O-methyltransferase YrrM
MSSITKEHIQVLVESLGSDSLKVVGGKYEGGIHLQQIPDEIAPCIFDLLKLQHQKVIKGVNSFLEIGAAAGGNAFLFNYFFTLDRLVLIDNNKHPKHNLRPHVLRDVPHDEFIGDSHSKEAVEFVENLGVGYDILFIDGDHTYEGVKKDIKLYAKFVNYQGFIIFHDTVACPGIKDYMVDIREDTSLDLQFIKSYVSETHPKPCGLTVFRSFNLPFLGRTDK